MPNLASSTGTTTSPWFRAFKPRHLIGLWRSFVEAYLGSPTKGGFRAAIGASTRNWLHMSTQFERYIVSEVATSWMGPFGEVVQQAILRKFGTMGLNVATVLTPTQMLVSKALGATLVVGATIAGMRLINKALHHDDWKKPPRYKEAYSRLHSMENGQPFFGSGALNDNILRFGQDRLDLSAIRTLHPHVVINPARGGLPQELNRTANTHYLMGAAVHEHNARLFNVSQ